MAKIIPHLWFDNQVEEATQFYTTIFPDSKIINQTVLHDTPSGDTTIVIFQLWGQEFMAINGGPIFKFNPSISFMVNFDPSKDPDAEIKLDEVWEKLADGGKALMPKGKYPFSEKFGWIEDKYGLSWQLILTDPSGDERPAIMPTMLFVGDVCGKAKEATDSYISIFKNSNRGNISLYPAGSEFDQEGTVMFTDFKLENYWFVAMDSALKHEFAFNEAVSIIVNCENQSEIDYFWEKLSAFPESEQCGWLKDKYGVSWQISSGEMDDMLMNGNRDQIDRVTQAFLPMKKIDITTLKKAYQGE